MFPIKKKKKVINEMFAMKVVEHLYSSVLQCMLFPLCSTRKNNAVLSKERSGIMNEGDCSRSWATLALCQGGTHRHCKEERWSLKSCPEEAQRQHELGEAQAFPLLPPSMNYICGLWCIFVLVQPKAHIAPIHAASRAKWLLGMITTDHTFV